MPEAVHGRCCSLDDVYDARRVAETVSHISQMVDRGKTGFRG
jgi:hypothetical protein